MWLYILSTNFYHHSPTPYEVNGPTIDKHLNNLLRTQLSSAKLLHTYLL